MRSMRSALSPAAVTFPEVGEVTRESFEAALRSSPAFEEINAHLELLHKDEEALKAFVKTSVMRND